MQDHQNSLKNSFRSPGKYTNITNIAVICYV